MTDPKRWLEDQGFADSIEARVLAAGVELEPPAELVEQSFAHFATLVGSAAAAPEPALSAGGAGHGATVGQAAALHAVNSTATAALGSSLLKALGFGAVFGTLTMTGAHYLGGGGADASDRMLTAPASRAASRAARGSEHRRNSGPSTGDLAFLPPASAAGATPRASETSERKRMDRVPQQNAPAAASSEFSGEPTGLGVPREKNVSATGSSVAFPEEPLAGHGAAPSSTSGAPKGSALKAEAMELAQAKNLLEQGRAGDALTLVVSGSKRFANGVLADERELLTVQALSSLGRREEARKRANAFLSSRGQGSIALRMQRLLERL